MAKAKKQTTTQEVQDHAGLTAGEVRAQGNHVDADIPDDQIVTSWDTSVHVPRKVVLVDDSFPQEPAKEPAMTWGAKQAAKAAGLYDNKQTVTEANKAPETKTETTVADPDENETPEDE